MALDIKNGPTDGLFFKMDEKYIFLDTFVSLLSHVNRLMMFEGSSPLVSKANPFFIPYLVFFLDELKHLVFIDFYDWD